ncbi:MAG: hypothetical protein AAF809_08615 [Bacteroidota bacterium]
MEEVLAIVSLFVVMPTIIFSFVYRMRKLKAEERIAMAEARRGVSSGSEEGELRLSELEALIEDAVDEATAPLRARIAALERGDVGPLDPLTGDYLGDEYQAPNGPQRTVGRVRG